MASTIRRPNGSWRARYRDEAGREHSRHFPRKVDAQRWLDEVTASIVTGQYVDPGAGRVTFDEFYREWAARQVWVQGTRDAMDLACTTTTFGPVALRVLRASHFETWIKTMVDRPLAPSTVHTRVANVRAVLRAAVRDRVIPMDPTDGVTLPRVPSGEQSMRLPLVGEIAALLDAVTDPAGPLVPGRPRVTDPAVRTAIELAAFGGLRAGEICGVQLGDIDFLGRTVKIDRQVQRGRGGVPDIRPPKYLSYRTVALDADVLTTLSRHVTRLGITAPDGWLFVRRGGRPWNQNKINHWWPKLRTLADAPDLTLHDLRHFYASGLIAEGCEVVTVQRALGHKSAMVTLNTYTHLWPQAEDRTRRASGALRRAVFSANAAAVPSGSRGQSADRGVLTSL